MFVGHEFLAFALAGGAARWLGCDDAAALRLGAVATLAALLPDLDIVYAAATYAVAVAGGTPVGWEAFWGVANAVHRIVTHPLPVGAVAALVFGAAAALAAVRGSIADDGRSSLRTSVRTGAVPAVLAAAGVAVLLPAFRTTVGTAAALVAAAFLVCVGAAGWFVARSSSSSATGVTLAAAVGFLTHPFGDVFLARPPPLLSPLGPPILVERVALATDPTLEILAVLFVELASVWFGVIVFSHLSPVGFGRLREVLDRRAALGVAYAGTVFVLPPPTIVDAHVLGFTIVPLAVAVGLWTGHPRRIRPVIDEGANRRPHSSKKTVYRGFITGLATLTVAAIAYTGVYVLV
ncbi:metal-dependent hydrolase [Halobellus ordinarius]|uniref:metal-dependent hydrolase n=1 Tax=Halobellus ordinarius TaxID=3075120 RepID=UPI002880153F|nr:metal-dependent hydrolase [Halobellus sp. ZY16]